MGMTATRQYRDDPVDVKLVLSVLWVANLFVFAYIDILAFYRADVLRAALSGKVAGTVFAVNQVFLSFALAYILVPTLMVVLSLLLRAHVNQIVNIVVSALYMISVIASGVGEHRAYYILGSIIEVVLLALIARTAWRWPRTQANRD